MIALSRRLNQSIMVGGNLELKVRKITIKFCSIQIISKDALSLSIGETFAVGVNVKPSGSHKLFFNQTIHVSENTSFTILEARNGSVRIGVKCPQELPIHRGEIYNELRRLAKK